MPDFDRFLPILADWSQDFDFVRVRGAALEGKAGELIVHSMRLDLVSGSETPTRLQDAHGAQLFDLCMPAHEVSELVQTLGVGTMNLRDLEIRSPVKSHSFYYNGRRRPWRNERYETLALTGSDSYHELVEPELTERADYNMCFAAPPWDGLADVRARFVGLDGTHSDNASRVEMHLPAPGSLSTSRTQEAIQIALFVHPWAKLSKISLSVMVNFVDGSSKREILTGDLLSQKTDHRVHEVRCESPPTDSVMILSYRGVQFSRDETHYETRGGINARLAVLRTFQPDSPWLAQPEFNKEGDELEKALANLFRLAGFNTFGGELLGTEAPDLVCFSGDGGTVIVIECTGRELNQKEKISKFHARIETMAREFDADLIPILATAYMRNLIHADDIKKAESSGMLVYSREEIQKLYEQARAPGAESRILKHLHEKKSKMRTRAIARTRSGRRGGLLGGR